MKGESLVGLQSCREYTAAFTTPSQSTHLHRILQLQDGQPQAGGARLKALEVVQHAAQARGVQEHPRAVRGLVHEVILVSTTHRGRRCVIERRCYGGRGAHQVRRDAAAAEARGRKHRRGRRGAEGNGGGAGSCGGGGGQRDVHSPRARGRCSVDQ